MADFKIGVVSRYYDKIGVAVVDLTAPVHVGDYIRVSGSTEFTQKVESLQMEHERVDSAMAGDTVGLKVDQALKPGDEIIKAS